MSKRQQIVDEIISGMETIADFATVTDWGVVFDDEELPALAVCDVSETNSLVNDQPTATRQINALQVLFRIIVRSGTRASELRSLIGTVNDKIRANPRWNDGSENLALWTKPVSAGIVVNPESFEIAGASVEIEIGYMTNSFDSDE